MAGIRDSGLPNLKMRTTEFSLLLTSALQMAAVQRLPSLGLAT
jgi:hypothetical protein